MGCHLFKGSSDSESNDSSEDESVASETEEKAEKISSHLVSKVSYLFG